MPLPIGRPWRSRSTPYGAVVTQSVRSVFGPGHPASAGQGLSAPGATRSPRERQRPAPRWYARDPTDPATRGNLVDGTAPRDVTAFFLDLWREVLVRSGLSAGCAVLAVTVATDSPDLLAHAADVFRAWRARLMELFVARGVDPAAAERFAATLVAASEGAVVVSRAERSLEPFELVATQLLAMTPLGGRLAHDGSDDSRHQLRRASRGGG